MESSFAKVNGLLRNPFMLWQSVLPEKKNDQRRFQGEDFVQLQPSGRPAGYREAVQCNWL
jgi:hypothetical protein